MTWWTVQQSLEKPEQLKESIVEKEWRVPFTTKQQKVLFKFFYARWKSALIVHFIVLHIFLIQGIGIWI